jgi:hypothetical protein
MPTADIDQPPTASIVSKNPMAKKRRLTTLQCEKTKSSLAVAEETQIRLAGGLFV